MDGSWSDRRLKKTDITVELTLAVILSPKSAQNNKILGLNIDSTEVHFFNFQLVISQSGGYHIG